jgi:uncharacterized protein (DUF302 family)
MADLTSVDGLVTVASPFSVRDTIDRLESEIKSRGISIYARVDHAAGAESVGMALRPTELLIFGNPRAGTPLMQSAQSLGIDLPLKMLAWQNASGEVMLSYNDIRWLVTRHEPDAGNAQQVDAIALLLERLATLATG